MKHLFSGPEGVLRRHVLDVVDDGVVGQQVCRLVDLVYGVFESQFGG